MKIVKLVAENVKRIHAVTVEPGPGALVTIAGKNGAGKSSVLDSIAYAMGGEKLVPSEPIRAGESEARVVVDLGDLVVTRRFKREKITNPTGGGVEVTWGETTSTLVVTNKDGARYPSPQAVLDKLLGKLTFDPLDFARMSATAEGRRAQDALLRRLVGVDVAPHEARRKEAFDRRAMAKKTLAIKEAQVAALPHYADAPPAEVPADEVIAELAEAERLRATAEAAEREVEKARGNGGQLERQRERLAAEVDALEKQLKAKGDELARCYEDIGKNDHEIAAKQAAAEVARAAVPDTEAIGARIKAVDATNTRVRANAARAARQAEVDALAKEAADLTAMVEDAERMKKRALEDATFPIPGLGLSEDGVTFGGYPFEQAGSAEQVRVSVAIGIALNPGLKVLLVRNGNLLDKDSLAVLAAQAEEAGMQVWMEFVAESKDGATVMMVDGEAM